MVRLWLGWIFWENEEENLRWGTGCLLRETQWNLSTRMGESDTCTAFSFILTKTQTYLPNTYNVHSFPLIVAGTLTIPHWPLTSPGETKPILSSTTLTSGIFHTFDLNCQNIRVFMFLCRVFMFADMQSGDSVIIKAQVSMSSPLPPSQCQHHYQFHHFWRLAVLSWKVDNCAIPALKIQLSPKFSTNASISCHVRGGEGLKPLNGRLGSNWGPARSRPTVDRYEPGWGQPVMLFLGLDAWSAFIDGQDRLSLETATNYITT